MNIDTALSKITVIRIPAAAPPVYRTAAERLAELNQAEIVTFNIATADGRSAGTFDLRPAQDSASDAVYLQLDAEGTGQLTIARPELLFAFVTFLCRRLGDKELASVRHGRAFAPAFDWHRPVYDFFLCQEGRMQRGLNKETYVRRLAESGFTHLEVNGLATPMSLETGPKGETYPMFYTYCPALDQFVSSSLNEGLYPTYHLSANLANLKANAALAARYGLIPGLLCFEPRSVPERFFDRYPMLRGARVDHPFRSFKPRYNMTIAHPRVREHYAEMMTRLMAEVPELGFLSIWANDSGAGFEHTKSLYVGRNGGAYLIREWNDDEAIARVAGDNALRFLRTLRDAARATNPAFRVITRLESFYGEHDVIWEGLGDQLEVESASLIARGWEMPYAHPRYPANHAINAGSIYQTAFHPQETDLAAELDARSSAAHFYFSAGPQAMFAPLLGVPYPTLTAQRLKTLHSHNVRRLAHLGGTCPPELVPYNINHEILGAFQFDPELEIESAVDRIARDWAGPEFAATLTGAWRLAEEAILAFPNITPLYSTHGFTWYRLWARPLVPNIEAIPPADRAYYERFMCTTPHNPNNVDLSRDVLFQLTTPEQCRVNVNRIDERLWPPLQRAIAMLDEMTSRAQSALGPGNVIHDQLVRLRALHCWFMTQRNVAAWIVGVHGWLDADDDTARQAARAMLRDMMQREIDNTRALLDLLATGIHFMAMTDLGETPLIYGENLPDLLRRRIDLMQQHMDDEPFIDPDYMERNAALPVI